MQAVIHSRRDSTFFMRLPVLLISLHDIPLLLHNYERSLHRNRPFLHHRSAKLHPIPMIRQGFITIHELPIRTELLSGCEESLRGRRKFSAWGLFVLIKECVIWSKSPQLHTRNQPPQISKLLNATYQPNTTDLIQRLARPINETCDLATHQNRSPTPQRNLANETCSNRFR